MRHIEVSKETSSYTLEHDGDNCPVITPACLIQAAINLLGNCTSNSFKKSRELFSVHHRWYILWLISTFGWDLMNLFYPLRGVAEPHIPPDRSNMHGSYYVTKSTTFCIPSLSPRSFSKDPHCSCRRNPRLCNQKFHDTQLREALAQRVVRSLSSGISTWSIFFPPGREGRDSRNRRVCTCKMLISSVKWKVVIGK